MQASVVAVAGSIVVVHWGCRPAVYEILQFKGSNLCHLHCQAEPNHWTTREVLVSPSFSPHYSDVVLWFCPDFWLPDWYHCPQVAMMLKKKKKKTVQFRHTVLPNFLWPHGLQHARLPRLSPTPGVCSKLFPFSWWSHPTISSSVIPFSCLESLPASRSIPMSQFFTSGGQSIGVSAFSTCHWKQWLFRTDFL